MNETSEYQGPSKIGNAWHKSQGVSLITTSIASIPFSITLKKVMNEMGDSVRNAMENGGTPVEISPKGKKELIKLGRRTLLIPVTYVTSLIGGAIWGWNQAGIAKQQHVMQNEQIKDLSSENERLETEAKWAERMVTRNSNLEHTTDRGI